MCIHSGIIRLSVHTVTSELQGVEVCTDEESFFIRCIFFTNSIVSGCNYVLEGVSNISDHIARSNSQGTRIEVNDVSSYSNIIVYDASSQTDISSRDIGIRVFLQNVTKCLATDVTSGRFTHSSINGKLIFIMSAFDIGSCSFDIWVRYTKDLTQCTDKTYINNIHPRNSV